MVTPEKSENMPIGRKISRIRELRQIKQGTLADELGLSQQAISKIEQGDQVSDLMLEKIAEALGVTPEAIKNYSDESVIYNVQNNYDGSNTNGANGTNSVSNNNCTFNPLDKLVEALDANKELYERLLASEREKIELLKRK